MECLSIEDCLVWLASLSKFRPFRDKGKGETATVKRTAVRKVAVKMRWVKKTAGKRMAVKRMTIKMVEVKGWRSKGWWSKKDGGQNGGGQKDGGQKEFGLKRIRQTGCPQLIQIKAKCNFKYLFFLCSFFNTTCSQLIHTNANYQFAKHICITRFQIDRNLKTCRRSGNNCMYLRLD